MTNECAGDGGIGIAEMLFMTSLVAVVGAGDQPTRSPRRLQIINTKSRDIICEQNFVTAILSVKLNKKRCATLSLTALPFLPVSSFLSPPSCPLPHCDHSRLLMSFAGW